MFQLPHDVHFCDPAIGRFVSADSVVPKPGDPQNLNRYAYARNVPLTRLDPTGHLDVGALILCMGDQFFDDVSLGSWSALNVDVKTRFEAEDSVDYNVGRVVGQVAGLLAGGSEIGGGISTIGGSLGISGLCVATTVGVCTPLAVGVSAAGIVGSATMVGHGVLVASKVLSNGDPLTKLYAQSSGPGKWKKSTESMSARAAGYQGRITGKPGEVYRVNGIKFDGYKGGTLLDAKGPGYANFVKGGRFQPWFDGAEKMVIEARNQLRAANGVPITWHVAEQDALDAIRNLFRDEGISGINLTYTP